VHAPKLPAVIPPTDTEKLEEHAIALVADYAVHLAQSLFQAENSTAFNNLPEVERRRKNRYRARELLRQTDKELERRIFAEWLGHESPTTWPQE